MELFVRDGYEGTTVSQIAERAGLTERTFFRHFADKREVLFGGGPQLQQTVVGAIEEEPADAPPMAMVVRALQRTGDTYFVEDHRDRSRRRQTVIDANPSLQERELIKLASLATAIAEALASRQVERSAATLIAETAILVFKVAFGRWIDAVNSTEFGELVAQTFQELRTVAG